MKGRPYGYAGKSGQCLWCGGEASTEALKRAGTRRDGHFCSIPCAVAFAVQMARCGHRLKAIEQETGS